MFSQNKNLPDKEKRIHTKKKKVQKEVCIQEYDGFVVTDLVITGSYTSMMKQSGLNDSGQQAPPLCIALHDQPNFHCLWKIQQAPEKFIAVLLPQTYEVAWTQVEGRSCNQEGSSFQATKGNPLDSLDPTFGNHKKFLLILYRSS